MQTFYNKHKNFQALKKVIKIFYKYQAFNYILNTAFFISLNFKVNPKVNARQS